MLSLQEISDRMELERLTVDYAYAIDERNYDVLDSVFTPDAYIDYRAMGGIDGKYPDVKVWLSQALAAFPHYMHLAGNFTCDVKGDTATGKIACFNPMVVPNPAGGAPDTMFLGLWCHDKYLRTSQGWRIIERVETKSYDYNMPEWMKVALKIK